MQLRVIPALAGLILVLGGTACRPETPKPPTAPPTPQTAGVAQGDATHLRDAINAPLDRARAVESTVQQAEARKRAAVDAQQ